VAAGTHPDLLVFGMPEEKHEFPKEVIQELIRHLSMKPARGKKRVTIVEDADQLNEESANAFLKTLEEPPPSSLLILLGTSPDFQLPTIRSRCQIIRFQAVSREAVAELLVAEGVVGDLPQARRLADLGSGSLLRARILAEPNVIDFRAKLLAALDRLPFASVSLAQESWKLIEEAGKETSLQRRRAQLLLDLLIEFFRGVLLVQQGVTVSWPDPRDGEIAQRITHRLDTEQLLRVIDRCLTASNQIDRRVMLALLVEGLFDSLGVLLEGNPVAF
jgi:DNA polymerase-3 subunit delta'